MKDYEIEEKMKKIANNEIKRRITNLQLLNQFESEINTVLHKSEQEILDLKVRMTVLERKVK